jgi:hypothetical protein
MNTVLPRVTLESLNNLSEFFLDVTARVIGPSNAGKTLLRAAHRLVIQADRELFDHLDVATGHLLRETSSRMRPVYQNVFQSRVANAILTVKFETRQSERAHAASLTMMANTFAKNASTSGLNMAAIILTMAFPLVLCATQSGRRGRIGAVRLVGAIWSRKRARTTDREIVDFGR